VLKSYPPSPFSSRALFAQLVGLLKMEDAAKKIIAITPTLLSSARWTPLDYIVLAKIASNFRPLLRSSISLKTAHVWVDTFTRKVTNA